jgi:hypothetical protein
MLSSNVEYEINGLLKVGSRGEQEGEQQGEQATWHAQFQVAHARAGIQGGRTLRCCGPARRFTRAHRVRPPADCNSRQRVHHDSVLERRPPPPAREPPRRARCLRQADSCDGVARIVRGVRSRLQLRRAHPHGPLRRVDDRRAHCIDAVDAIELELLQLDAKSIRVSEYITELPPLPQLRARLHQTIEHAREQAARRLPGSEEQP